MRIVARMRISLSAFLRDVRGVSVRVGGDDGDERQVERVQCARRLPQRGGGADGDQA